MAEWPVDNKVVSLKEKTNKPSNRQTSSAGYTMSFPKGTVSKKILEIGMAYLTKENKDTIVTFFDSNQGKIFTINDPDPNSDEVFSVVFDQDELEFTYTRVFPGEYTLTLNLREV